MLGVALKYVSEHSDSGRGYGSAVRWEWEVCAVPGCGAGGEDLLEEGACVCEHAGDMHER